jgi:hypothetical protein
MKFDLAIIDHELRGFFILARTSVIACLPPYTRMLYTIFLSALYGTLVGAGAGVQKFPVLSSKGKSDTKSGAPVENDTWRIS